jgi:anti-sigma-K factor RskA
MSDAEDDLPLLAAEYALGSLDLAEMRRVEASAAADPDVAQAIADWDRRLAPLARLVAPVQPPPALWMRLALATGSSASLGRRTGGGWKAATAVSLALAASLALFAFLPRPPSPQAEPNRFVAALGPLATPARFIAVSRPDGALAITNLTATPAPPGRDYELWALPQGATAPQPLGVVPTTGRLVNPSTRPSDQEQLLISDEPAGGSPTGAPTGPVVFGGTLVPFSQAASPRQ